MKLLLTSNGLTTTRIKTSFLKLLPKTVSDIYLIYVPTAVVAYGQEEDIQGENIQKLSSAGIKKIQIIDFSRISKETLTVELERADVIWIGGGNTFYLLEWARRCGFLSLAPTYISKGLVYAGVSAGSILAGPDIRICEIEDHDENTIGCKNIQAMNLVPYSIYPHYDPCWDVAFHDIQKQVNYDIIPLRDDQAILVNDSGYKII